MCSAIRNSLLLLDSVSKHSVLLVVSLCIFLCLRTHHHVSALSTNNGGTLFQPIVGIDIGNNFFKVAAIIPGQNVRMVVNKQSHRRTPTALAFTDIGRLFGDEAMNQLPKNPENTLHHFIDVLGRVCDDRPYTKDYFPMELACDESRGGLELTFSKFNMTMSPEEAVAHVLSHIRELIESHVKGAKSKLDVSLSQIDVVFSIPVDFGYRQRQALSTAAKLAKFNVLCMVHAPVGAAIHYSLDLMSLIDSNNTNNGEAPQQSGFPQVIMFLDLGSSQTQGCLVRYSKSATASRLNVDTLQCVSGRAISERPSSVEKWGGSLGVDIAIAQTLRNRLPKDTPITSRLLRRILNEATKQKHLLSLNKESVAYVERVTSDEDLRVPLTRAQLEEDIAESGLLDGVGSVVDALLDHFEKTKDQLGVDKVSSIELLGGGWRVPRVYSHLSQISRSIPLGQRCNGDEAMAHGAALVAANFSSVLKLRPLNYADVPDDFRIRLDVGGEQNKEMFNETELWGSSRPLAWLLSNESVVHDGETIEAWAINKGEGESSTPHLLDRFTVSYQLAKPRREFANETREIKRKEFEQLQANNTNATWNSLDPGSASYPRFRSLVMARLNHQGLVSLDNPKLKWREVEVNVSRIMSVPSPASNVTEPADGDDLEEPESVSTEPAETPAEQPQLLHVNFTEVLKNETVIASVSRVDINLTSSTPMNVVLPLPLSSKSESLAKSSLLHHSSLDRRLGREAELRNSIETFIYNLINQMDDQDIGGVLLESAEKNKLSNEMTKAEDWLYSVGLKANESVLEKHYKKLQNSVSDFLTKVKQQTEYPKLFLRIAETVADHEKELKRMLEIAAQSANDSELLNKAIERYTSEKDSFLEWVNTVKAQFEIRDLKKKFDGASLDRVNSKYNESIEKPWNDVAKQYKKVAKKKRLSTSAALKQQAENNNSSSSTPPPPLGEKDEL